MSKKADKPTTNEASEPTGPTHSAPGPKAVASTLLGVVEAWTAYGLRLGKTALARSAKALQRAARRLDALATRLAKKPA